MADGTESQWSTDREVERLLSHLDVAAFDGDGKQLGIIFETTTPFNTPAQMRELINWTAATLDDDKTRPLICIAIFIVSFLAIHPFQDGNGRLSRVLTSLLLLRRPGEFERGGSSTAQALQHRSTRRIRQRQK